GVERAPTRLRVAPVPRPAQPAEVRVRLVGYLEPELRAAALAVGVVEPVAGPLRARLEVGGVRATRDVDDRPLGRRQDVDLAPVASLGGAVLGVHRVVGLL